MVDSNSAMHVVPAFDDGIHDRRMKMTQPPESRRTDRTGTIMVREGGAGEFHGYEQLGHAVFARRRTSKTSALRATGSRRELHDIRETFVDRAQLQKLSQPTLLLNGKRIPGLKLDHLRQLASQPGGVPILAQLQNYQLNQYAPLLIIGPNIVTGAVWNRVLIKIVGSWVDAKEGLKI
jgi:hypothetical protein